MLSHRTTIMLPISLKREVGKFIKQEKTSLASLIRSLLEKYIHTKKNPWKEDSFFLSNYTIESDGLSDVAKNHDKYLYEDADVHHEKTRKVTF